MISFPKLGNYGRLGNQLFQYAFLRSSARRLGVQFHCPKWDGGDIFDLDDLGRCGSLCQMASVRHLIRTQRLDSARRRWA
jgi:hypothetical protein